MSVRPNIVYLLNDHQAHYGHGEAVGGPAIRRPGFDRLAAGGVDFRRAYTACPLCGPARRTMLTGLLPHEHGEVHNDTNHPFDRALYLDQLTEAGYRSYYYGKWHAGPESALEHGCQGLSYPSYGNPYTTPEYRAYLEERGLSEFEVRIERSFWNPEHPAIVKMGLVPGALYQPRSPWCNEHAVGVMTTPRETHEAFFLASLACERLRQIAASDDERPFHLRVDFWGPHQPYFAPPEYADLYDPAAIPEHPSFRDDLRTKPRIYLRDGNHPLARKGELIRPNPLPWSEWQQVLRLCYAQITLVDEAGAMILDALEDLGLSRDTLVIWATDHGDALACHGGHFDKAYYMPEEMMRIPMALRLPGQVPAGTATDALVSNLDLAPTFLDAAGIEPANPMHGRSLLPLAAGDETGWREDLMAETHGHVEKHLGRMLVTRRHKYVWNDGDLDELYDLERDPYEMENRIDDPGLRDVLADLRTRLGRWQAETGDEPLAEGSAWRRLVGA